jgi:hypothetical protein
VLLLDLRAQPSRAADVALAAPFRRKQQ